MKNFFLVVFGPTWYCVCTSSAGWSGPTPPGGGEIIKSQDNWDSSLSWIKKFLLIPTQYSTISFTHMLIVWYLAVSLPGIRRHNAFCCLDWGDHLTSHHSAQIIFYNKVNCKKEDCLPVKYWQEGLPRRACPNQQPKTRDIFINLLWLTFSANTH